MTARHIAKGHYLPCVYWLCPATLSCTANTLW